MTEVEQMMKQIVAWLEAQAASERELLDSPECRPDARERVNERWMVYKTVAQEIRRAAWAKNDRRGSAVQLPDEAFAAFVERHQEFGYGRMMQVISDLWRTKDPRGALSVGDTYAILDIKRARCAAEGHDVRHGNSYDWCDRCGARLDPDSGETL